MNFDIMFFEALGEENGHLSEELEKAKATETASGTVCQIAAPEGMELDG